jgi:hypothetical protein
LFPEIGGNKRRVGDYERWVRVAIPVASGGCTA